mgnify:CR=1 FL=1
MNKYKAAVDDETNEVEVLSELRGSHSSEVLGYEIIHSWPRDEALEIYFALHWFFDNEEERK